MQKLEIQAPDLASALKEKMTGAVRDYYASRPRSQQVAIGPSQLGNPCDRQLALKSLGYGERGQGLKSDPWTAFIGTSVHAGLESVYQWHNETNPGNWIIEQRVEIAPGISGTADLFHDGTVIDHKIAAEATMTKARKGIVSETYRVQLQAYGYGFTRAGYDVANVAIAFWPRGTGAWLGGLEIVSFPYEADVTERALTRWYTLVNAAIDLDLEHVPERAQLLPTADGPCTWCPFFDFTGRAPAPSCKGHKRK